MLFCVNLTKCEPKNCAHEYNYVVNFFNRKPNHIIIFKVLIIIRLISHKTVSTTYGSEWNSYGVQRQCKRATFWGINCTTFLEFRWYNLIGWFGNFPTCTGFPNHKHLSFTHHTFTQARYPTLQHLWKSMKCKLCLIRAEINCTTFLGFRVVQSDWPIWQLSHLY